MNIKRFVSRFILCVMLLYTMVIHVSSISVWYTGRDIAEYALEFENCRYCYGGTSPDGFDCSGFVWYVYHNFGYDVGRTSSMQYGSGMHIEKCNLLPGDIVLFNNTYKSGLSHSGIYIGNGKFIHAEGHESGVTISNLSESYYNNRFVIGIRVINYVQETKKNKINAKYLLIIKQEEK